MVANRLRTIGIRSVQEDTNKACTAILVHVHMDKTGSMPDYKHIYKMSQDLIEAHSSSTQSQPIGLSSLAVYPDVPPPELVKLSYLPEDPPVIKVLPKLLNLIANHIPVTRNNRLLLDESNWKQAHASSSSSNNAMYDCTQNMMLCTQQIASQGQNPTLNAHIQMCSPSSSKPSLTVPTVAVPPFAITNIDNQPFFPAHHTSVSITSEASSAFHPSMRLHVIDLQTKVAATTCDICAKPAGDYISSKPHRTLADYASLEFDQLTKRKPNDEIKPAQSFHASSKPTSIKSSTLKLGCPRCRGSIGGCSTCKNANYNGIRLHGKTEWEKHMKMSRRARLTK